MNLYQQPYAGLQQPVGYVGQPVIGQPFYVPSQPVLGPGVSPEQFGPQPFFGPRLPEEQSYIENILRLNTGKVATVYMSFENSQWGSKIFRGYVLAAGKDHIVLKDLQTETRYILLMVYLSYITFEESISYDYPIREKKEKSS